MPSRLGFATPPEELDSELTVLSGRLPQGLEGVLFRAGPAQFERAGERLGHWFDGDGMIQRFVIGDGGARHRGRFVDTPKRRAEAAAGRFLYSGYGFAPTGASTFRQPDELNAANTNVLEMGDEIWALWEGGSPWRLDSTSLATLARQSFPNDLDGLAFSAHPKRGPDGDIWNFGGFGRRCIIWRLNSSGGLIGATPIELPASTLMHDFAVTGRHIILLAPPMSAERADARTLIDRFVWRAEAPLSIIVLDKNDLTRRRVYELPAKFLFHVGNAWEDEAGVVRIDACLYDDADYATRATRTMALDGVIEAPNSRPTQIVLHPDGRVTANVMSGFGEFPRIDQRRVGERHRYTYGVIQGGVARWDWRTGHRATVAYGAGYWAEEPIFVPQPARSAETHGWLIQTRLNLVSAQTELVVLDARALEAGPVAVLACPYALPLGFHGCFAASSQ